MITAIIIGTGNMASAIISTCKYVDIEILGIFGRNSNNANELASKYQLSLFENINVIPTDADLYLFCVNDDAINEVSNSIVINGGVAVHFSGLKPITELANHANKAVFWPIESINKNTFTNFNNTPICIEANSEENYRIIEAFADRLSKNVVNINSNQRQYLHLAATITNNFSNHLIAQAKQQLDIQNLDYKILKHLLIEAINNSFKFEPNIIQTGPAVRNDRRTMQAHLDLISNDNLKALYLLMSKSIFEFKQNNHA